MTKTLGIVIIILGILMMVYTGFNYMTSEKVVDAGRIQISRKTEHPVSWSPIVGGVLLAGGIFILLKAKK